MNWHINILKKISLPFLAALFLLPDISYAQNPAQVNHYDNGLQYAIQGKFYEAKDEFEKALLFDQFLTSAKDDLKVIEDVLSYKIQRETALRIFKSLDYRKKRFWPDALAEIDQALLNNPNYANGYYYRALVYFDEGANGQAMNDFNKAIELNPQFASAYIFRGYVYANRRLYNNAISDFNQAIMLDPGEPLAYVYRALAYDARGMYSEALNDYNKAIEINPNSTDAYMNRGLNYCNRGLYEDALSDINKAIDINPYNIGAYKLRGYVYLRKQQYDRAISDFNLVVKADPWDAGAYNYLGLIYVDKRQYDEAIYNFDKAIKLNPDNEEYYRNRQFVLSQGHARNYFYAFKRELEGFLNFKVLLIMFIIMLINYSVPILLTLFIPFKAPKPVVFVAMLEFLLGAGLLISLYIAKKMMPSASNVNLFQILAFLFGIFHIYLGFSLLSLFGWARSIVLWFQLIGGYMMASGGMTLGIFEGNLIVPTILIVLTTANGLIYYFCLKKDFFPA